MSAHLKRLEVLARKELESFPFTAQEIGFLKRTIDKRSDTVGSGA